MGCTSDIITHDDYEAIKLKVNKPSLDDTVIEQTPFLPLAEARIKEIATDWAAIKAADSTAYLELKVAVICLTASYLLGVDEEGNPTMKSEKILDYSYTNWTPDELTKIKEDLVNCYRSAISNATGIMFNEFSFTAWGKEKSEESV